MVKNLDMESINQNSKVIRASTDKTKDTDKAHTKITQQQ